MATPTPAPPRVPGITVHGQPGRIAARLAAARRAQAAWAATPVERRLALLRRARWAIAEQGLALAATVRHPQRRAIAETLSAEVIPLADACRFLERRAARLLAPRRLGMAGRPLWLAGSRVELRREPLGLVLVVGPSNYPLLLPGVQALQALAAGNAAILKPGAEGGDAATALAALLVTAGLDPDLVPVLPATAEAATEAISAGVDQVVLTGSLATGRSVLAALAPSVTPAILELSGCDAVIVRADADLDLVVRALRFGLTFNGSATCIAPRRLFVHRAVAPELEARLAAALAGVPPVPLETGTRQRLDELLADARRRGGRLLAGGTTPAGTTPVLVAGADPGMALMAADIFAPLLALCPVADDGEAVALAERCPYALGAAVFGSPAAARDLASRLRAGVVVVNDLIAPTADPRVPFGGRGASGFGRTRGAEGLLAMTASKAVIVRRGSFRPHLEPLRGGEEELLATLLRATHGPTLRRRGAALRAAARAVRALRRAAHVHFHRGEHP